MRRLSLMKILLLALASFFFVLPLSCGDDSSSGTSSADDGDDDIFPADDDADDDVYDDVNDDLDDDSTNDDLDDDTDDDLDDDTMTTTSTTTHTTTSTTTPTTSTSTTTTMAHTEDCTPTFITPVEIEDPMEFDIDPPYEDGDVLRQQLFAVTAATTGVDIAVDANDTMHIAAMYGRVFEYIQVDPDGVMTHEMIDKDGGQKPRIIVDADGYVHILYQSYVYFGYIRPINILYATNMSGVWTVETIDTIETFGDGIWMGFALDMLKQPHTFYVSDDSQSDVYYAKKSGGTWLIESVIPADGKWRAAFSLAFDAEGTLHEVHAEEDSTQHYWNTGSGWQSEMISSQRPYAGTSLAIGDDGVLHVAYSVYGGSLAYATNAGGAWDEILVDWCGALSSRAKMVLGALGAAHVVYADGSMTGVRYATNASGSWEITRFSAAESLEGWYVSAAMDSAGAVHIAEYGYSYDSLYYLTNASGAWGRKLLAGGRHSTSSKPVFDEAGHAHILLFLHYSDLVLHGSDESGIWRLEGIGASASGGYGHSIAVGPDAVLHAALPSADDTSIYYAARSATDGSWALETLDTGEFGSSAAAGVDSAGRPRVVYHREAPNDHVVYAAWNDGVWEYETIDPGGAVGGLVFDDEDRPTVLYCPSNYPAVYQDSIFVATRGDDGIWTPESLFDEGRQSSKMSLALGLSGEPHVVFYNRENDLYYYFVKSGNGQWEIVRTFDLGNRSDGENDLFIDDAGYIHLALWGETAQEDVRGLVYISNISGSWERKDVDLDAGVWNPSLTMLADGDISVVYKFNKDDFYGLMKTTFSGDFTTP